LNNKSINTESVDLFGVKTDIASCGIGNTAFLFLHPERGLRGANAFLHALSQFGRVIAPYHPGFKLDAPHYLKSVDDLSYFYLDLMEALDLNDVTIVGSSLGGWLAMEIASKSNARISSLCLLAPAGIKMSGRTERDMQDIFSLDEGAVDALSFSDPAVARSEDANDDLSLELVVRAREASARYAWLPYMHNPSLVHRLHRIKLPTLIISGEEDRIVSADVGRDLAKKLPRGEFAALSGCGHYPHIERAELTARQIAAWQQRQAERSVKAIKGVA